MNGAKVWFILDGYLATPVADNDPAYKNHQAFCIMNVTDEDAHILIDFYFPDRDPVENIETTLPAKRGYHVRTDKPEEFNGFQIPYGARLRSDVPIVVQYSRMDSTTRNISLMTTMAYSR